MSQETPKEHQLDTNMMRHKAAEARRVHLDSKSLAPIIEMAAEQIDELRAKLQQERTVPQAVKDLYAVLEPFAPQDRSRLLRAVHLLLIEEPKT